MTLVLALVLCSTSVDGATFVQRTFRSAPALRGNVNVIRSQPIDEASWLWLPGDSGKEPNPTFLVFRKSFEVSPGETPLEIDVSTAPLLFGALSDKYGVQGFEIGFAVLAAVYVVGACALFASYRFCFAKFQVEERENT